MAAARRALAGLPAPSAVAGAVRDPDPYAASDADGFRRAVHQLLARHSVFQQDVLGKAHRFGVPGITRERAAELYTLGETLPDRQMIEVATGLCGLTPAEQDQWLDAWDRIEYGPRYALLKRQPQQRLFERMTLASSADEERWRTLVAFLYESFGTPPVPGYSAARVEDVLSGRAPLDDGFVIATLTACEKNGSPTDPRSADASAEMSPLTNELKLLALDAGDPDKATSAGALVRDTVVHGPDAPLAAGSLARGTVVDQVTDDVDLIVDAGRRREEVLSRVLALAARLDRIELEPGPPRPAPPDPDTASTPVDFVRLMNELRVWSGKSLRALGETARQQDDWNLPASSLSDALRATVLPRIGLLWALTGAAGLSRAQRERWMATRDRLEHEAPPVAEPDREPTGGLVESELESTESSLPRDEIEPAAADGAHIVELVETADMAALRLFDTLRTARQRLRHQCGYQGVCAEGVSEVQAPEFTARDTQRDGRVWLPGVASAYGREQLARDVLLAIRHQRRHLRRRLQGQLVELVGQETVDLVDGRLHVPAAELPGEVERRRREGIEYKVDRATGAESPAEKYTFVSRYGLLGIAARTPNDVHRHQGDIQAVLDVLDSMSAAIDPARPWWKRRTGFHGRCSRRSRKAG